MLRMGPGLLRRPCTPCGGSAFAVECCKRSYCMTNLFAETLEQFDGNWKDYRRVFLCRNVRESLQVAQLQCGRWLADHLCGLLECTGRLLLALRSDHLHYTTASFLTSPSSSSSPPPPPPPPPSSSSSSSSWWLRLSNSRATSLIWSAHTVSLAYAIIHTEASVNLDTAARRFSVAAPRLWNSLPLNCWTAPSVNTFKIRLKTFLFDSA